MTQMIQFFYRNLLKPFVFFRTSVGFFACLIILVGACTSTPTLRQGVQPDALALNPARIAAFPTLLIPHPSERTSLDPASLASGEIVSAVESRILAAFKNQPGVNGLSFQTVRTALKANPKIQTEIDSEIRSLGQLANSGLARETLLLSAECRARRHFLDFYKNCLLRSPRWIQLLNQLSMTAQNADSALFPIVTTLEKLTDRNTYSIRFGLALILVDTNSGRLLWGRDTIIKIDSPEGLKQFPDLKTAYDKVFSESFWAEFPGRRSKPDSLSKP